MSSKLIDNKRRNHAEKVLQKLSQKNNHQESPSEAENASEKATTPTLRDQYDIIKEDLLKLRSDLEKGYEMAREMMDKKTLMNQILKLK